MIDTRLKLAASPVWLTFVHLCSPLYDLDRAATSLRQGNFINRCRASGSYTRRACSLTKALLCPVSIWCSCHSILT